MSAPKSRQDQVAGVPYKKPKRCSGSGTTDWREDGWGPKAKCNRCDRYVDIDTESPPLKSRLIEHYR